jgi:hypothetical protein
MRKIILLAVFATAICNGYAQQAPIAYEYKMFTAIESVIGGGLGRSRILETDENNKMKQTDLGHLFAIGGLHLENIHENDQLVTGKINEYSKQGWELDKVVNGVYSREGGGGIYLTRYIFRKPVVK